MADTVIYLDIHADKLVALAVEHIANVTLVAGCTVAEIGDQSFAEAIDRIAGELNCAGCRCRITIGAELFSFKNVKLPFSDRKKIGQILPLELSDLTPVDIDTLIFDYMVVNSGPDGAEVLTAMLEKQVLADWFSAVTAAEMKPDFIGISGLEMSFALVDASETNFVLLDIGTNWATLFLVKDGRIALIRSFVMQRDDGHVNENKNKSQLADDLIRFIKQTLTGYRLFNLAAPDFIVHVTGENFPHGLLSSAIFGAETRIYAPHARPLLKFAPGVEAKYSQGAMGRVLPGGTKKGARFRGVNFCKDDFRKSKTFYEYRKLAFQIGAPLVAACLLITAYFAHEYHGMDAEHNQLKTELIEVFRETLPESTRIVNPTQQLQIVIKEIREMYRPGGASNSQFSIIDIMTELSARIPATYTVQVNRLVIDNEAIRFKAVTGDFNTVDTVQKELEKSPYFKEVAISSANQVAQSDEVSFELKAVLAKE